MITPQAALFGHPKEGTNTRGGGGKKCSNPTTNFFNAFSHQSDLRLAVETNSASTTALLRKPAA